MRRPLQILSQGLVFRKRSVLSPATGSLRGDDPFTRLCPGLPRLHEHPSERLQLSIAQTRFDITKVGNFRNQTTVCFLKALTFSIRISKA